MSRPVGIPKTGGRKKGTPNKNSDSLSDLLSTINFDPLLHINQLIPQLDPYHQAKICLDLLSYIYPKRKALEMRLEPEPTVCPKCAAVSNLSDQELKLRIKDLRMADDCDL